MKYLIFIFLLISNIGFSQEINDLLQSRQFVIEANKMTDVEGRSSLAIKRLCFILIDSTQAIIQWTSNGDNNGLGGITIRGEIKDYNYSSSNIEKEEQYLVHLICEMDEGRVKSEINAEIYSKSHAEAVLSNQTSSIFVPQKMKFQGKLVPLQDSNVIIGSD